MGCVVSQFCLWSCSLVNRRGLIRSLNVLHISARMTHLLSSLMLAVTQPLLFLPPLPADSLKCTFHFPAGWRRHLQRRSKSVDLEVCSWRGAWLFGETIFRPECDGTSEQIYVACRMVNLGHIDHKNLELSIIVRRVTCMLRN